MEISDVYRGLGEEAFGKLIRCISIGKLKTYQVYEGLKVRAHLNKLNQETLRKATPRFWERIMSGDEEFGRDLGQSVLVSHLDMIVAALNLLGVPHENGFFAKDLDPAPHFTEGWEDRVYQALKDTYPVTVIIFYINHLRWELLKSETVFQPVGAEAD